MNISVSERPGVYTGYDASSIVQSSAANGAVGIVCAAELEGVTQFLTASAARSALGGSSKAAKYVELALGGGASACWISPVGASASASDYGTAAKALREKDIAAICCDSNVSAVMAAIKSEVADASSERHERIAVFAMSGSAESIISAAGALNSERCVMVGPVPVGGDGETIDACEVAVAAAAAIVSLGDPALPLGGVSLSGLYGAGGTLTSAEVDALVRGGVTAIECLTGEIQVIRGVTTRTKTGGESDATWRELSTILIVDDVMKTLRSSLRSKFARAKNLAETRESVASQVSIELAAKKNAGIIADYGSVSATATPGDPTRCDVEFEFAVAHGLDRIVVAAHILV